MLWLFACYCTYQATYSAVMALAECLFGENAIRYQPHGWRS